jgi:hypothetical protein
MTATFGPSEARNACAASSVVAPSVPGRTGTPVWRAIRREAALSPNKSSVSGRGPTKISPASAQARAKAAFSLRKP